MPRLARKKSQSGIYHIILRGINRQSIFEDDDDKERLLETLVRYKEKSGYSIYAYCFMDNHFHLLLKVGEEPLEQIMRRICGSYVYWFNKKYERIGNLFQDRFRSEPVEKETYFLTVVRYIHQNPIKARITESIQEYKWNSYCEYIGVEILVDRDYVLNIFADDSTAALESFVRFHNELSIDECMEIEPTKKKISDEELRKIINDQFNIKAWAIQSLPKEEKKVILKKALKIEGISTRQLSRVTGVSTNVIWKL